MTEPTPRTPNRILAAIGPGILFAGAAIGVSHLIQSTRAGALYGLTLIPLVILAHAAKLPALLFGPRYAAATGDSLVEGYRRRGPVTLTVFALITLGTAVPIVTAVSFVTAVVVQAVVVTPLATAMGWPVPPNTAVLAGVLALASAVLLAGGFGLLDKALKVLMLVMLACTLAAAALETPELVRSRPSIMPSLGDIDGVWIGFVVAFVGWMPAPLDIAAWHSIWSVERCKQTGVRPEQRACDLDFFVGYALCALLATAFVALGAALLHVAGERPADGAALVGQVVGLFTESIGAWARPVIAAGAVAVMFSTTITVLDAVPRVIAELPPARLRETAVSPRRTRPVFVAALSFAAIAVVAFFSDRLKLLVDIATTLSFLPAPLLAWFNHRAMTGREIEPADRPGLGLRIWSGSAVAFWSLFVLVWVAHRFGWIAG